MSDTRAFPILLVAALLAGAAAIVTLSGGDAGSAALEGTGKPLLPELAASVNDVARVELHGADGELTLRRAGELWRLETWEDFPAKPDSVKRLVVALADAVRLQARTALAERHHLLDVEQPPEPGSDALRVRLADALGGTLADVVLGSGVRGPPRSERVNARVTDSAQTWLVEGAWRPPTSAAQWVEQQLLTRPAEDMAEVELTLPDGTTLSLERTPVSTADATDDAAGDDASDATDADATDAAAPDAAATPDPASAPWRLARVPDGREPAADADLDTLADALASLRMQAVTLEPAPEAPDETWAARFTTHDGLVIHARVTRAGDTHRLKLDFSTREGSGAARSDEAQRLAREVGAWEYEVSSWVAERFRGDLDALLAPLPEPEPEPVPVPDAESDADAPAAPDVAPPTSSDDPAAAQPVPVVPPAPDDDTPPDDGDG